MITYDELVAENKQLKADNEKLKAQIEKLETEKLEKAKASENLPPLKIYQR